MPDSSFESVAELVSKSDNQLLGQVVSSVREALLECSPEEADAHVVAFLLFVNEFMPEALDGIEPGVGSSLQKDTGWEGHIKDVLADNGHYYFGPISKHMYGIMGSGPGRMDVRGYGPRGKKNPKKSPTHSNAPAQADHGRGSGTRDTHEEITGIVRMLGARDGEIGGDTKAQYDALSEQDKQDLDDIEATATKLGITLPTRREMKDMSHEDLVILMDKLGLLGETRGGTLNVVDSDVEGGEGFKRRARDVSDYAPKAERGAGKNLKQSNNSGVKSALDTYRKNKQRREDGTLDGKITDDDKRLGTISRHDTDTHDKPRPGMKHRVSATEQDDAAAAGIKPGKRGYGTKDQEGTADQQPDMTENKFKVQQAKQKLKNKAKLAETERAHIADLTSGKADIPAAQAEDLTGTKVPEKAAAGPAPTATPDAKQKLKDNLKRADVPSPEDTTAGPDPVDAKQKLKDNLKRVGMKGEPEEPAKPELSPSQQKLLDYIETLPDGHPRKRLFLKALNEPSKLTKAEKSMISKIANKKDKADLEYGGYAGHQKLLTDEQRAASEAAMRARMQFTGYGKDDLTPENFVGGYDPAVHGERAKPEAKVSPEKLAIPNVIEAKGKKFVPYGTTDEKSTPDFGEQQPATSPSDLFAKLPGLNAKSNYSFAGISGELLYDEPDHKGLSEPTRDSLDGLIADKESSKEVKDAAAQLLAIDDSNKAGQTPEWLSSLAEADKMAWKLDGTPDGGDLNGAITELLNGGMSPATRRAVESISGGSNEPGAERAASLILQSADLMSKVPEVETPKVETPKVETPKVEAPKVETPKVEAPKVDGPSPKEALGRADSLGGVYDDARDGLMIDGELDETQRKALEVELIDNAPSTGAAPTDWKGQSQDYKQKEYNERAKERRETAQALLDLDDAIKAGNAPEWYGEFKKADALVNDLWDDPDTEALQNAMGGLRLGSLNDSDEKKLKALTGPAGEAASAILNVDKMMQGGTPSASAEAPEAAAPKTSGSIPDFSDIELTPTGKQGGSTGAKFAKDKDGNTWIIKDGSNGFGADPKDRVASELAANAIYRALGANVPEMGMHNGSLAYKLIDGKPVVVDDKNAELSEHFLVDALLANYDFLGTGGADERNIIQGSDGKMYRIDHGGVFDFRAQGGKKEYGNDPLEHIRSMLDSSKGGQGAKILDASEADLQAQAKKISSTMDGPAIAAIFDGLEWSSPEHGKKIRKAFVDRLVFMDELGDGMDVLPADVKSKLKAGDKAEAPAADADGQPIIHSKPGSVKAKPSGKYALYDENGKWYLGIELNDSPTPEALRSTQEDIDEALIDGGSVVEGLASAPGKLSDVVGSKSDGPNATPDFASIPDVYLPDAPTTEELKEQAAASGKGLSTGMIVVDKKTGKLWIYEPLNGYGGYDFTFPKGQQEDGLTAQQNAHKELFEETGLKAKVTGYLGGYDKSTSLSAYFIAEKTDGDPIESGPETASVREVTFDEAKKLLNTSIDKTILDDLEQKLGSGKPGGKTPDASGEDTDPLGGVALEATPGTSYDITYKDGTTDFISITTMASDNAIKQVQNLLDDAAKKGAKVVTSPDNFSPKPKSKVLTTPDGKTADQIKQEIDANASLSSSDKKFMKKDLEEVLQGNMSAYTLENLTAHSEDDAEWGDNARQTFKDIIAIGLAAKGEAQPKNDSKTAVTASEAPKLLKPGTKKSLLQQKSKAAAAIDKALAITTNSEVKFKLEELRAGLNDPGSFNPASINELAAHSGTRVNAAAAEVTKLLNEWNAAGQPNLKPKSKEQRDLEAKEAAKLGEKTNTGAFVQQLKDKPLEAKLEALDDLSRQIGEGAEDSKILRAHQASLKQHLIATTDLNKSELDSRVKSVTSKAKRDKETAPEREARAAEKAELGKLSKQELIEKAIDSHRELGQFLLDIAPSLKNTPGTVNDEYAKEYERLDRQKGILAEVLKEQHGLTASQLGGLRAKGKKQVVGEPDTSFIQLTPEQLLSAAQGDKAKMILDKAHVQVPPEVISAINSHQGGTFTQREVLTARLNHWKSQGKLDRGLSAYELMAPEYAAPGEGTWEQSALEGTRAIWREADRQNGISEAILNIRHGESQYGVGGYTLEELQGMIGSDMVMQEVLNGSLLPSGSSGFRHRDVHIIQYCPPGDKVLGFTAAHKVNKPEQGEGADSFATNEAELYPAIGAVNRIAAVEKNSKDSPYYDPLYKEDDWLVVLQRHSSAFGGADAEKVMREDRKRRRAQENAKLKVLSDKLNGED